MHTAPALWLGPALVAVAGTILTLLALTSERSAGRKAADAHLDRIVERAEAAIAARFETYEDALIAGTALFATRDGVTSDEWRRFTETQDVTGRYPGITGVGVIYPLAAADAGAFTAEARANVDPGFAIRRFDGAPEFADLFVITYLEPRAGNEPAIGLDVGGEANRRKAIETARDTGRTTMTGSVTLVTDQARRPGFLVYVPFYRPGARLETVEDRRAAIKGFVYAPFVDELFLDGILGSFSDDIDIQVTAEEAGFAGTLVYSAGFPFEAGDAHRASRLSLGGQTYGLRFQRASGFASGYNGANWILATGILATCAVAAILTLLVLAARRAKQRAVIAELTAVHRGDLVNLASHELRNPLAILSLSAEMLEAEASVIGSPELMETAAAARAAAGRAEALVSELLDLSRMDAERLHLDLAAIRLSPALDEAIALTSSHWGERPVTFSGAPAGGHTILADSGRLAIVLRNMVDNAFKYSPEGAEVTIAVEPYRDNELAITVSDRGDGVSEADRDTIFERFSRGGAAAHTGGLGIGLHLSRELARRMGGDLQLLPGTPGEGARFRLLLRTVAAAPIREPAHA